MRLQPNEKDLILQSAHEIYGDGVRIYLFGSRTNDAQRGGDIDLLVRTEKEKQGIQVILPMTVESFSQLDTEQIRCLDQFIFRFSKLQDAMGAKLFRFVLEYLDEDVSQSFNHVGYLWKA